MSFLELIRAKNCFMAGLSGIIGYLIANSTLNFYYIILIFLAIFFICGFGNCINDIFDIEIDRINKPYRPLPSGRVSIKTAKILAIILLVLGLISSLLINLYAFLLALFNSILLYLYAKKYKRYKPIGNIIVAYLTGSVFLFGGLVGRIDKVFILFLCSFLATWCREIIKDYEDMEGDKKEGVISLPILYKDKSLYFASILLILAVVFSFLPYYLGLFGKLYLIIILVCDIFFIYSIFILLKNRDIETAKKVSKLLKMIMVLVLLAFLT
ncbi:UbiA family prenyltransferase [Methanocaldococcus indicus]|uniref:UbiA family prenyltransferase n=1 Tax=Methanocaldococcus indicus TaxID=213231 RepID=UPI003C6CCABB